MRSIRAGKGLGDAMYLQAVARHFVRQGEQLEICSNWPEVFRPLGQAARVVPFRRINVDICAHYTMRKRFTHTNQFEDCCIQAGIREPVDFKLDWAISDPAFVESIKSRAAGKPLLLVQLPRLPMDRQDGFGRELLPDCRVIQSCIDRLRGSACVIQAGSGEPLFRFHGVDIDCANATTVSQLIDLGFIADAMLGYSSFTIPLAEQFSKPALLVWARAGLQSTTTFIRQITPEKILSRSTSKYVVDDWPIERITGAADALL